MLGDERLEVVKNVASMRDIVDEKTWPGKPGLQIVDADRDVLSVVLVEDPELSRCSGQRHAMAIVVKQHSLVLSIPPKRDAEAFRFIDRRIQVLLVPRPQA